MPQHYTCLSGPPPDFAPVCRDWISFKRINEVHCLVEGLANSLVLDGRQRVGGVALLEDWQDGFAV